ncbi:MAG: hypothetical protein Q9219_004876 [cf. Caloplaca sp. 3 TL-2023]
MDRSRPSYWLLDNKAYSDDGTSNGSRLTEKKVTSPRSRWPHALNVVTNFSKPPQLVQQAANTKKRRDESGSEAFQKRHRRLNSSVEVQTPNAYKRRNSDGGKRHDTGDSVNYDAALGLSSHEFENTRKAPSPPRENKGPINDLKRASSRMTNLSPSDRPIVIGISVPSDKLDQHTISPDAGPTPISNPNQQLGRSRRPSDAPTVLITPAKPDSQRPTVLEDQLKLGRRRAPSSLYSRATNARGTPKPGEIPPMPPAPRRSLSLSRQPDTRIASAYTVFDEDESPAEVPGDRKPPAETSLRTLKRSSTDSIATRRRSQGWWNHIMSPFFPKPGGVPWRSPSRITAPFPNIHESAVSTPPVKSKAPSIRSRSSSSHTSIWTDFDPQDSERQPADITMLHSPFHESSRELEDPEKDLTDWFNSLGTAAEYYHACWHDEKYSSPYFECQNHVCIPRRPGNFPLPGNQLEEPSRSLGTAEDSRELAVSTKLKDNVVNDFQQTPANRFSAAFKEAISPESKLRKRPPSETAVIDEVDATPIVHEAQVAPVVRAPAPVPAAQPLQPDPESKTEVAKSIPESAIPPRNDSKQAPPAAASAIPARSPPVESPFQDIEPSAIQQTAEKDAPVSPPPKAKKSFKPFVAIMPPDHPSIGRATPMSPEKASPAAEIHQGPHSLPLNSITRGREVPPQTALSAMPPTIINHYHYGPHQQANGDQVSLRDLEPPPKPSWSRREMEEARAQEKGHARSSRNSKRRCPPNITACLSRGKPKNKKQKWLLIGITSGLVIMIVVILLLAMLLTRKGDDTEVQSQWLNLTGFPPIPTGISTIVQPNPVQEASGCIHPATLWSCAVPKEQQASIAPNPPDQPNFRIEIRFQNGSLGGAGASNGTELQRRWISVRGNAVSAGDLIRNRLLHVRDFTSNLFSPSPAPPAREDQIFLGNTTDKNQQPFDGVATPFFLSFIDARKLPGSKMAKRAPVPETDEPFPNLGAAIPSPSTDADGTASPASLYPLVTAQPLRLYDRDKPTEHYGFYTYFDRSIFLKSTALLNFTGASPSEIPDDENGGAEENAARVRCTWAQTRFLVQIWTRRGKNAPLLQDSNPDGTASPGSRPKNLTESSANNFTRPGSFPYPISVSLDRHGGDIEKKMIYCYGLDQQEHIISDEKQIQLEDRAFGGTLVNPAQGPFGTVNVTGDDGGPGGIDGGSGGCGCRWENFGAAN